MVVRQSRDTWLAIGDEDPYSAPEAEASRAAAPVRRLAAAALLVSGIAIGALGFAAWRPAPHKATPEVANAWDAVGLADEAKAGSLTSKLAAMVSASQAGSATQKGWYMVVRPAILREGRDLDTTKKGVLQAGDHVLVSEVHDRRAKVEAPQPGWVSIKTAKGEPILAKADLGLGAAGAGVPGLGGLQQPTLPTAGKGSEDWKKMSASELDKAIKKGKVNPNVVMADGFGKLSGFLSDANKELEGILGPQNGTAGSKTAGLPKDGTTPFVLPSFDKVQAVMEGRMAGDAAQASQVGKANAMKQKLLSQDALQVADKLLHNEGKKLSDATKGLTGVNKAVLRQTVQERQDSIDQARATQD